MDSPTTRLDFSVIGHQDGWHTINAFMHSVRTAAMDPLPDATIKSLFPCIPPRDLFRVSVRSATGKKISGVYIETFIDPDKLTAAYIKTNISKVIKAADCAKKLGARVTTLGGFTSIILEGDLNMLAGEGTKFTTGNTLTAAFIVKGIEKAAWELGIDLSTSNCLVIGSTGDIGSACVQYMKHKAGSLLLCARNMLQLKRQTEELEKGNINVSASTNVEELCATADIIIAVTSSTGLRLENCKRPVLICDAGYPKNLAVVPGFDVHLFHGGMGQVSGGFDFMPDYSANFYCYPAPAVIHGCILEAMVLAFEERYESYSAGKGKITVEKMEAIYSIALKHGIDVAPFFHSTGLWHKNIPEKILRS